jgi:hypothetical protein
MENWSSGQFRLFQASQILPPQSSFSPDPNDVPLLKWAGLLSQLSGECHVLAGECQNHRRQLTEKP